MAREPQPHPETDQIGETIEFEPIPPPEYVWLEATREAEIKLEGLCEYPVEIRIGQTGETRPFLLDDGSTYRELLDAAGVDRTLTYVLVQPDVMEKDPRRGWAIIPYGETVSIGRAETPQFQLGRDIAREGHLEIENMKRQPRSNKVMRIEAGRDNPVKVRVKSDSVCIDRRALW
jgi:hypothetical protein